MKTRHYALALSALALAAASFAANAAIVFQNLGTNAPPSSIGGHALTPFDLTPQIAIPNYTTGISVIPGSPVAGSLGINPTVSRRELGNGWWGSTQAWGHGYTGPVFYAEARPVVLTLPPNTRAFYFYVQPDLGGTYNVTATTNSGTSSGPVPVLSSSSGAANGFAFYSTAGEVITSISITNDAPELPGMAVAEFGIGTGIVEPSTTCASEGYTGTKLLWCQNICEKGYTGAQLDTWIHRWINRYRDLPYCAQEGGGEEPPPPPPQQPA